jgi:integrase
MLSTFYVWSIAEGIVTDNPVIGTRAPAKDVRRERVLSAAELSAIWHGAPEGDFGNIITMLILTGLRRKEVAEMRWSEIHFDEAVWKIPGARTKNKLPHEVPLSATAIEILQSIPQRADRDLVFGSGRGGFSGFSKAKKRLDISTKVSGWVLHDIRRSVATGMANIGIMPHIVEAALSHISGHKAGVAGIYNRATYTPEKRDALDRWSSYVTSL